MTRVFDPTRHRSFVFWGPAGGDLLTANGACRVSPARLEVVVLLFGRVLGTGTWLTRQASDEGREELTGTLCVGGRTLREWDAWG